MSTMAAPKKKSPKRVEPVMTTRGLRMTEEYATWLEGFAKKERMSVATLIDRALAAYAEGSSFDSPPERVP